MAKYEIQHSGEWVCPKRRGYKMMCCDCGLVHIVDFQVMEKGKRLILRMRRDNRATGQARRWRKNEAG